MEIIGIERLFSQDEKGIYELFGSPASGKTEVLILACIQALNAGYSIIFIDCKKQLNIKRFTRYQEFQNNFLEKIIIFRPNDFKELILQLDDIMVHDLIGKRMLVIDDALDYLVGSIEKVEELKMPGHFLNLLFEISSLSFFPVLFTTQARKFDNKVKPYLLSTSKQFVKYYFEINHHTRTRKITISKRNY